MIASPMRSIQTVEACLTPLTPVLTAIKSWFTFLINLELIILGSTICETARSLTALVWRLTFQVHTVFWDTVTYTSTYV